MRTFAFGLIAAAGLAFAVSANAQGVSVGTSEGGTGVGVSSGTREGGVSVRERTHVGVGVRERRREGVTVGVGAPRHCKVVVVHREGMTKKIKRCD